MKAAEQEALRRSIGATASGIDQYRRLLVYKYNRKNPVILKMILEARLDYLNWQTINQRYWQRQTKNVNKVRHHDSIAIREKYVTCSQ